MPWVAAVFLSHTFVTLCFVSSADSLSSGTTLTKTLHCNLDEPFAIGIAFDPSHDGAAGPDRDHPKNRRSHGSRLSGSCAAYQLTRIGQAACYRRCERNR